MPGRVFKTSLALIILGLTVSPAAALAAAGSELTWKGPNGGAWNDSDPNWIDGDNNDSTWLQAHTAIFSHSDPGTQQVIELSVFGGADVISLEFREGNFKITATATPGQAIGFHTGGNEEVMVGSNAQATLDVKITGIPGLNKTGGGTLILTQANDYTGDTTVAGGTLSFSNTNQLGDAASSVTIENGSVLSFTAAGGSLGRSLALDGGGTVDVVTGGELTLNNPISGDGGLTKTGGGTLFLTSPNNSYGGGTVISQGKLVFYMDEHLGQSATSITIKNGAVLSFDGGGGSAASINTNRKVILTGGGVVEVAQAIDKLTLGEQVGGDGGLTKTGPGELVLTNDANNYTGGTTISAGRLTFSKTEQLGAAGESVTVNDGAVLSLKDGVTVLGREVSLTGAGGGVVEVAGASDKLTLDKKISGSGGLKKTGAGELVLTDNDNDYTGGTTVSQGYLSFSDTRQLGQAGESVTIAGDATLSLNGGTDVELGRQVILGGSGNAMVEVVGQGQTLTLDKQVSGNSGLYKNGAGTLRLSEANTYQGETIINQGKLVFDAADRLGGNPDSKAISINTRATLSYDSGGVGKSATLNHDVRLAGTAAVEVVGESNTLTLAGQVFAVPGGGLTKTGLGTLVLEDNTNSYTGDTSILAGRLSVSDIGQLGDADNKVILNGQTATLTWTGNGILDRELHTGAQGGTIEVVGESKILTLDQGVTVAENAVLNKTGTGRLTLNGDNSDTFSGSLQVTQGTVSLNHAKAAGSRTIKLLNDDSALVIDTGPAAEALVNDIYGPSGSLSINSGAKVNLTGAVDVKTLVLDANTDSQFGTVRTSELAAVDNTSQARIKLLDAGTTDLDLNGHLSGLTVETLRLAGGFKLSAAETFGGFDRLEGFGKSGAPVKVTDAGLNAAGKTLAFTLPENLQNNDVLVAADSPVNVAGAKVEITGQAGYSLRSLAKGDTVTLIDQTSGTIAGDNQSQSVFYGATGYDFTVSSTSQSGSLTAALTGEPVKTAGQVYTKSVTLTLDAVANSPASGNVFDDAMYNKLLEELGKKTWESAQPNVREQMEQQRQEKQRQERERWLQEQHQKVEQDYRDQLEQDQRDRLEQDYKDQFEQDQRERWKQDSGDVFVPNTGDQSGQSQPSYGGGPAGEWYTVVDSGAAAGWMKTKSGGEGRTEAFNAYLGAGRMRVGDSGVTMLGLFGEYGRGDYDTSNRFAFGSVKGEGQTTFTGAGLIARQAWANGLHIGGSFRAGRVETDFKTHDLGFGASYETSSNYYGGHLDFGKVTPLAPATALDLTAGLHWTRQEGDRFRTKAGEVFSYDDADSLSTRLSARVEQALTPELSAKVKLGWEHEFDGTVKSRLDGDRLKDQDLKGDSGTAELGLDWNRPSGWSASMALTGSMGRRQGFGGRLAVGYSF